MVREQDLDSHVVREADAKSLVDHIFFQADAQISHEQGQALARIAITTVIAVLLLAFATFDRDGSIAPFNLILAAGYALFSVVYYRWIAGRPLCCRWRRYLVILLDLGMTGYVSYLFDLAGLGFYAVFLWIMIGNGLRFGPHYLGVATLVGTASFSLATYFNGTLAAHPGVVVGLVLGLLMMPRFFLAMIHRLADANRLLAKKKEEAEYQASHDVLTGLPNRALLESILVHALSQAEREGSRLAIVFIDLDSFKAINDSFGHAVGDELLQSTARCLKRRVRASDTVARLGGDEFIVLLEDCGEPADVAAIVDQLFGCSGRYYRIGHHETYVTWSSGVAVFPNDGTDSSTLIKNADTAMYQAKAAGINQFRLYNAAMSSQVAAQLQLRDALRRAIDKEQFEVHYQPQVSFPEAHIANVEALLRWRHPDRGLMLPAEFLAAAEQSGLIVPIGRWVIERAIVDVCRWREEGLGHLKVHVNVSPHQLGQSGFIDEVCRLCELYHWPPADLGLEITEGTLIDDLDAVVKTLEQLRQRGFVISLDDFGTGFSSLAYLKSLPINRLKIDSSFVRDIPHDAYDRTLVEATMKIAEHLGLTLVAEGVEKTAQRDWLIQRGCVQMQGFLFAPALTADDMETLLQQSGRLSASG
jgi:diguanylate cyclase (GGDEF)-like protein